MNSYYYYYYSHYNHNWNFIVAPTLETTLIVFKVLDISVNYLNNLYQVNSNIYNLNKENSSLHFHEGSFRNNLITTITIIIIHLIKQYDYYSLDYPLCLLNIALLYSLNTNSFTIINLCILINQYSHNLILLYILLFLFNYSNYYLSSLHFYFVAVS